MGIRVSRSPHGSHWVWWESVADARECGVLETLPATDEEAAVAEEILAANARMVMPDQALGDRMRALLAKREAA